MASPFISNTLRLFSAERLVAVVTGGGTGIGLMLATALENNGATVYIVGRRKEVLEDAAKEHAKHGKIIPLQGDVTSRESLRSIASNIKSKTGYINLLINNAGIYGPGVTYLEPGSSDYLEPGSPGYITQLQRALWDVDPEEFQHTFHVNVTAVYYTTVAFLELLERGNRHGIPGVTSQVITVASIAGFRRDGISNGSNPKGIAYHTSKAAAIHFGKILANILKDCRIRSNIVAPGLYPSEMSTGLLGGNNDLPSDRAPMRRAGTNDEMGGLILYLATRAGAYVNGDVSITDGGRLILSSTH